MRYDTTRAKAAQELLRMATNGPSWGIESGRPFTRAEAEARYRNWAESWILPLLHRLVPELKVKP